VRIALLANPRSGAGEAAEVGELLAARGADVEVFDLDERARVPDAAPDRIVVAGGDGSIACAAEVAGRVGIPLAVVPVGTANDFARALGIPEHPEEAVDRALAGAATRRLDLGRADGERPFVNAVSTGLSPIAARKAHGLKRVLGPFAYAIGALGAGLTGSPVSCEVRCDGAGLFAGDAWQVTVGITGAFGGGAEVDADPGDGALDVVVIPAKSRAGLVVHAYGMRAGVVERQRGVISARGRVVEIEAAAGFGFNVDGELVDVSRMRLEVEPHAFDVITG
jgi:YegS/Rv2252/BmrU family lipid kinase